MLSYAFLLALVSGYCSAGLFCASATVDEAKTCFEIHAKSTGWAGIGINQPGQLMMAGADIYAGFHDAKGEIIFVNYAGVGHIRPLPRDGIQKGYIVPLSGLAPSWASLSYKFCVDRPSLELKSNSAYIWAFSNYPPEGIILNGSSELTFHSNKGVFEEDFTYPVPSTVIATSSSSSSVFVTISSHTSTLASSAAAATIV